MAPRRKRQRAAASRRSPLAKRPQRPQRQCRPSGQIKAVFPGLILGTGKAGYGITKALGEHQTKRAIKIAGKCRREVESGKRKRYVGESFNCSIMWKSV